VREKNGKAQLYILYLLILQKIHAKAKAQVSLKTEDDSFHKAAFSYIHLMLHLGRHILSSQFWRKYTFNDSGCFSQRLDVIQNYIDILIYRIKLGQQLLSKPNRHRILHLFLT
jgi:hypothetical protein